MVIVWMSGIWTLVKTTNPVIRAAVVGGAAYLFVEMLKPGFAFANLGGGSYIPRGFMEDVVVDDDDDAIVSGTYFPWWSLPLGLFVFFSLFV